MLIGICHIVNLNFCLIINKIFVSLNVAALCHSSRFIKFNGMTLMVETHQICQTHLDAADR